MCSQTKDTKDANSDRIYVHIPHGFFGSLINFLFPRKYDCHHVGLRIFWLNVYGMLVKPAKKRPVKECPACAMRRLENDTIRCALCGKAIIPYNSHVAYCLAESAIKNDKVLIVPGTAPNGEGDLAVTCLSEDCPGEKLTMPTPAYWDGRQVVGL